MESPRVMHYRLEDGLNFSTLVGLAKSPADARRREVDGVKETDVMRTGTAAHCLILEGVDEYEKRFFVEPATLDMRFKESKLKRQRWQAEAQDRTILKKSQGEQALSMGEAFCGNADAMGLLSKSIVERPLFWEEGSLTCKGLVDGFNKEKKHAFDIKTTEDISSAWSKCKKYYYDVQAAHYVFGLRANGFDVENYTLVFIERDTPHNMLLLDLSKNTLEGADMLRRSWLLQWEVCRHEGSYPPATKRQLLTIDRQHEIGDSFERLEETTC